MQDKAALHGIPVARITESVRIQLSGTKKGLLHLPLEKEDVNIVLRASLADRSDIRRILSVKLPAADGNMVPLSELVDVKPIDIDQPIYHKNLMPVVYVTGDVTGKKESPVYAILEMSKKIDAIDMPEGYNIEQYTASLPGTDSRVAMK